MVEVYWTDQIYDWNVGDIRDDPSISHFHTFNQNERLYIIEEDAVLLVKYCIGVVSLQMLIKSINHAKNQVQVQTCQWTLLWILSSSPSSSAYNI